MRLGWFKPVHCKSIGAQETRALLTARKLIQSKLRDVENSLRGILRGFGLKVGKTTRRSFPGRVRELVSNHASLEAIGQALLSVHAVLLREFNAFEKRVRDLARQDGKARLLMTTPAVGPIVALTYASAVDVRPGSNPRRRRGRISGSCEGKTSLERPMSAAASPRSGMQRCVRCSTRQPTSCWSSRSRGVRAWSWAMRIARRAGMRKAKAALARKLAVILHRMLAAEQPFDPAAAAA